MDIHEEVSKLFEYKEPIFHNEINLFESINVPWYYHLINVLQLKEEDFINIKNFVENEKNKNENNILNIINYNDITNEIILHKNVKNVLSIYLYYCKHVLEKFSKILESTNVHFVFVFGNITADMDSVCSSIIFSFFLFIWNMLKLKSKKEINKKKYEFFIPIININKCEMKLRIMILWWMKKIELFKPENILIFKDNENLLNVLKHKDKYSVCIVDFNDCETNDIYDINNVKCIVDHHMIKKNVENKKVTKSIYPIYVCSCMVIIAYWYKYSSDFLNIPFITKNIMWLIYGTILKDSNNFMKEDFGKRWVNPDLYIFNSIKKFYKIPKIMDIYITYKFRNIRFSIDLNKFGIENVLLADYKDYRYQYLNKQIYIRIASIDVSVDILFSNENVSSLIKKLFEMCKDNNISIFIFIGSYLNNFKLNKDFGIFFYKDEAIKNDMINKLLSDKILNISKKNYREIKYENHSKSLEIYQINNKSYSRKMLEYLINDFFI